MSKIINKNQVKLKQNIVLPYSTINKTVLFLRKYIIKIVCNSVFNDEITVFAKKQKNYKNIFFFFKKSSIFRMCSCVELTVFDKVKSKSRFRLFYNLLSIGFNKRATLVLNASKNNAVPSVFEVFSSVNWLEREAFDMFGVFFTNHPNLTNILTDYGFSGHPLKKEFPLPGTHQVYFSPYLKRVRYINK